MGLFSFKKLVCVTLVGQLGASFLQAANEEGGLLDKDITQLDPNEVQTLMQGATGAAQIKVVSPLSGLPLNGVSLWVSGLEGLVDPKAFVKNLPAAVGVVLSPWHEIPADLLALLKQKKCPLALLLPTPTRVTGMSKVDGTFCNCPESTSYYKTLIEKYAVDIIFPANLVDIDSDTLTVMLDFCVKNKLKIIVPPQYYSEIHALFRSKNIPYLSADAYIEPGAREENYKELTIQSMLKLKKLGNTKLVVALSEINKSLFDFSLNAIKDNAGILVAFDFKPQERAYTVGNSKTTTASSKNKK